MRELKRLRKEKQMLDRLKTWSYINRIEITWFLIGFFTAYGISDLTYHNYTGAAINFFLAILNYTLRKI